MTNIVQTLEFYYLVEDRDFEVNVEWIAVPEFGNRSHNS